MAKYKENIDIDILDMLVLLRAVGSYIEQLEQVEHFPGLRNVQKELDRAKELKKKIGDVWIC